jgi:hypothetical protein
MMTIDSILDNKALFAFCLRDDKCTKVTMYLLTITSERVQSMLSICQGLNLF